MSLFEVLGTVAHLATEVGAHGESAEYRASLNQPPKTIFGRNLVDALTDKVVTPLNRVIPMIWKRLTITVHR
jgi:hypothetical protein